MKVVGFGRCAAVLAGAMFAGPAAAGDSASLRTTVTVVDMIPRALSGEANQDSETFLAVDPIHPERMAATALTPTLRFCPDGIAPIFTSFSSGQDWELRCLLPSDASGRTNDITIAFGGPGLLFAGFLRPPD